MTKRCGYVAILGKPNVGKSTLLNSLVGAKLAGVSDKVQTTRNKILGIWVEEDSQLLFLDTPGLHDVEGKGGLNKKMMKEAWSALNDADVLLFLTDVHSPLSHAEKAFLLEILERVKIPIYLLITKGDKAKKDVRRDAEKHVLEELSSDEFKDKQDQIMFDDFQVISAKTPEDVRALRSMLAQNLPEGHWLYDSEELTDGSQRFIVSEYVREQIFRLVGDEIPYQSGVLVQEMDVSEDPVYIAADIYVERETHKRMIIGKGGQKIKNIGRNARESISKLLDRPIYLELFVKVKPGWLEKESLLREVGQFDD